MVISGRSTVVFGCPLHGTLIFAQLFLTFAAPHGTVAAFVEPMRMTEVSDLPAQQQKDGENAGGENQRTVQYHQRGADHDIVPVEDPAGGAAAVVHHPYLERTEEQDADDVTY